MDEKNIRCLLLTSYMPPLRGGSAVVYENLLKYGKGHIFVLTAEKDCQTNNPIPDAAEYRKHHQNLFTLPLLRQPLIQCKNVFHSIWVLLRYEIPIQISVILKVISIINSKKINVICIGELYSLGWLADFIRFFFPKIKIIFYIHGEELTVNYISARYKNSGYKYLQKADGIVAVSSFTKNILINKYNINDNKIGLVTNGIDVNHFNSNILVKSVGDVDLSNTDYILFVGRLVERKGIDFAIKSMSYVLTKFPHYKLLVAGDGDYKSILMALAKENKVEDSVIFLGLVSDQELNSLYQHCKLFIMPNRTLENGDTEGFGLVFLEANAFGKPVIAGNAGGAPDAVVHGKTGLLVNSESVDEISAAIIQVLSIQAKDTEHFTQACYEWAIKNNVKHKVDDFIVFLNEISK